MRTTTVLGSIVLIAFAAAPAFAQPPPPLTPLPAPPQPAGNRVTTAKANLGKVLFWDEQLSSTRTVACGSCHQASRGGSDPRSVAGSTRALHPGNDGIAGTADDIVGSPGVVLNHADGSLESSGLFGMHEQVTGRLAPSFINSGYAPVTFWDGRAGGTFIDPETGTTILPNGGALENQVLGPPLSSGEMGHVGRGWSDVTSRIVASKPLALAAAVPGDLVTWINGRSYSELFGEAFGSVAVSASRIAMAIASYERTLFSTQSPFDDLIAGNGNALTPQENAGFQLFGRIGCAGCHAGSLMSDNQFHYIGVRPAAEDSGRMIVTHQVVDRGAFRTPSLRNVGLRASFMHNGRFSTLAQVVDFYDRGGDFNAPNKAVAIRPLNLTPAEKAQLIAFLGRPLTDPRVAAQSAPFDRPSLFSESAFVPHVLAGGIVGASGSLPEPVALEPPLAGNPQFTVGVYGALGGAVAVLVIDETEPPATGGIPASGSFARVATTLAGSGASGGFGSATLPIPDDSLLYGKELYGRWYVADPAASGGVAASPAFRMQLFGPHGSGVLAVTPISVPRTLRLYAGQPNPFPSSTSLRFELFATSRVELNVYDISGRAVRRLYQRASAAPGNYAVTWDGRDDAGREVPGGMYFYRLDTDHGSETARVVRLQ